MPKYKRILLKLSGEALAGESRFGIDRDAVSRIAGEIVEASRTGVEFGVVVGGGNFFRGVQASDTGLQRVTVDRMGMLATVMNSLALSDFLASQGGESRVMSAVRIGSMVEGFSREAAVASISAGEIVIFAAGTGNPYFSTDTAASLRAVEIEADVLAKATKVDGVYDKDPVRFSDASRYEKISYADVLSEGLGVMDATAVSLCRENRLPILVFDLTRAGNIQRLANGESIGTLITEGE
jgi:uridylate kinase